MSTLRVADLHCDLLYYLELAANNPRTPFDDSSHCSLGQLQSGKVALQVLALFGFTAKNSPEHGVKQAQIFTELDRQYPQHLKRLTSKQQILGFGADERIHIIAAVENASLCCDEYQDINSGLANFRHLAHVAGPLLYTSLTWCTENRFGGGDQSEAGLKEDGKRLLDLMAELGVAVDLTHASDSLAFDVLTYIDKLNLKMAVLSSHSNFRGVTNSKRNLPDEILKEIILRKGILGLNAIREYLGGDSLKSLSTHVKYAFSHGASSALCFGADFYCEGDVPSDIYPASAQSAFLTNFNDSSGYQSVLSSIGADLQMSSEQLYDLAIGNVLRFTSHILRS